MSFLWSESIFLHFLLSFHSVLCKVPVMGNFKKKYELFQENRKYCTFLVFWQKNIHVGKLKKKYLLIFFFFFFRHLTSKSPKPAGLTSESTSIPPLCVFSIFFRGTLKNLKSVKFFELLGFVNKISRFYVLDRREKDGGIGSKGYKKRLKSGNELQKWLLCRFLGNLSFLAEEKKLTEIFFFDRP